MSVDANNYLSPLRPYNEDLWGFHTLYDTMPYSWDSSNDRRITLVSGNVIKGYRCKESEPYEIKY